VEGSSFTFPGKVKVITYVLMALGVIALIWGFFMSGGGHDDHGAHDNLRVWSNLLINGLFFTFIALAALFFYALQYAAEVAWSAQIKRIFEAMFSFLWIGLPFIAFILLMGFMHQHHIWHWMDAELYDPSSPKYDELIDAKGGYFTGWFFWFRTIAYIAVFLIFAKLFRKWSLQEDEIGGVDLHKRLYRRSALFLVFFAVFSSTLSWDWVMSIDTHWFSTLYGWQVFSGMWVTCMIFATIWLIWLKGKGYFPSVNDSHIHDLGKWVFAISMLWSYLWFSQFMLIWYANIPEETQYFVTRIWTDHGGVSPFRLPYFLMFFINFAVPFFMLISRDAKRNVNYLVGVGSLIFVFHFVDVYLLVMPGTVGNHDWHGFAVWETGIFLGFLGLFINVVMRSLSKAALVPKNHPLLEESEHHHI